MTKWHALQVLLFCFGLAAGTAYSAPDEAERAYQEGSRQLRNGEYEQAIESLSLAIQLAPHLPDAYRMRAKAYQAVGELEKALDDMERCTEIEVMEEVSGAVKQRLLFWMAAAAGFGLAGVYLASGRGHSLLLGLVIGAILGPFGVLLLLFIPERNRRATLSEAGPYREEDLESSRSCPTCAREVSIHTPVCPRCNTRLR